MFNITSPKYLICILFFLVNFALKVVHLTTYPLTIDEPLSTYFPLLDTLPLLKYFTTTQTAPLYDILMHFWIKFTGIESLFLLRLPSLILSSLTAGLLFLTGLRFFNKEVGLGAASIFVVSNIQVHFAQENRPYALFGFLSLLSIYFFLKLIKSTEKDSNRKVISAGFMVMVLVNTAMVYTHYFGAFVMAIELFACIVFKEISRGKLRYLFFVFIGVGVALLPIGYYVARLFYSTAILGRWWLKAPETPDEVWYVLRQYTNSNWGTIVALTIFGAGYFYAYLKRVQLVTNEKVLLLFFPVAWLAMLLISYITPIFLDRYTIYITPAFYMLVIINLQRLVLNKYLRKVLASLVIILFSFYTIPYFDRLWPTSSLVQKVNELKTPETVVVICPSWFNLHYIYFTNIELFKKKLPLNELADELVLQNKVYSVSNSKMINEAAINKAPQVIYIDFKSEEGQPGNGVLDKLRELKGNSEGKYVFGLLSVYQLN